MLLKVKATLKEIRESKGYTQSTFAKLLHMHHTTYSKIESGGIPLKPEVALAIASELGKGVEDFAEISGTLYHITGNSFSQSSVTGTVTNTISDGLITKIMDSIGQLNLLVQELLKK